MHLPANVSRWPCADCGIGFEIAVRAARRWFGNRIAAARVFIAKGRPVGINAEMVFCRKRGRKRGSQCCKGEGGDEQFTHS